MDISSKLALHDLAKADIFNDKNLALWKRWMDDLLHFDALTYVIESDPASKPADNAFEEELETYEQRKSDNKSVRHLLIGLISTDLVETI